MTFDVGEGVACDLDRLIASRLLVQASSGQGKSKTWAIRRLLEQTHGKVQHLVINPEGEYFTLRERFDYPTGTKLADYWLTHPSFGKCERAILRALLEHPTGLTAERICELTDYQFSGGFKNALATLRTAGVLVGRNTETMRAHEDLF